MNRGASSTWAKKIGSPFGDRDDGRVDRARREARKDRAVNDMKPRHACNGKVGTDDGARVRSQPAGSDRMVVREGGVLDERHSRVLACEIAGPRQ